MDKTQLCLHIFSHWFRSYLTGRNQRACINGNLSEPLEIHTGVPQGSILGPLLFILYINDLSVCLKHSMVNLYADDTLFFCSDKSSDTVSNFLQEDLANVLDWLHANKLSLHIGKTTSVLICNNQKRKSLNSNLGLSLNGTEVNQSDECKYLGVTFDQEFRFDRLLTN